MWYRPSLKFWLLRFDAKVLFECDYVFLSNTDTKWLYIEIYHVESFISLQANHLVIHVTIIKLTFFNDDKNAEKSKKKGDSCSYPKIIRQKNKSEE